MIRLAIIGTGNISGAHARAYSEIRGCQVVAACDVDRDKAADFARAHDIPAVYGSTAELLADSKFDAASVCTPDAHHAPVALELVRAGVHVLCEKPLAVNYPDAKKMADAARRRGVINMVNFSYRNAAAIHRAAAMIARGDIGRVMHLEASYLQSWLARSPVDALKDRPSALWRLSSAHGSRGVLGDLGVHILDFASYPAGDITRVDCRLKTFPKKGAGPRFKGVGDYVFDANDSAVITVELAGGAIGTIHTTRWATGHGNSLLLRIFGDEGAIVVDLDAGYRELRVCRGKKAMAERRWRTVTCAQTPNNMQRFIKSIRTGENDQPDFARGAAVQKVLDACFESDRRGRPVDI